MGTSQSTQWERPPDNLVKFKKVPSDTDFNTIQIPELAENRTPTDRKFLIVFGLMIVFLVPFLAYTLAYSDTDRYWGYDQCGNICGKKNEKWDRWECTGQDYTQEKYLQYERYEQAIDDMSLAEKRNRGLLLALLDRKCVRDCDTGYSKTLDKYCIKSDFDATRKSDSSNPFLEISAYLRSVGWRLTLACFLSLGVALSLLYLFRTATAAMVWSILVGVVTLLIIAVVALWYFYSIALESEGSVYFLWLPISVTILLVGLIFVIIFLHKKVALVIILLKEAMKVTFAIPQLMLIPILTFLAGLVLSILLFITLFYIRSSGILTELTQDYLIYQPNVVMAFTVLFTYWIGFWVSQFIYGIQYMVIAGAVSKWYFAADKNRLDSPILTSAAIAFKFHLGSVAFGSMIITLMAIVRSFLSSILKNRALNCVFNMCFAAIEDFLKYLSKNAYILTAMHGKPFYKSGKRAAHIIFKNVANIIALNYIGDFILFMAHVLVVLITLLFTYLIMQGSESDYNFIVYLIVGFVSLIVAIITFAVFETVIDTIFLCFCEDSLMNDGMARPYAMSRDLMEFVEESKKVFKPNNVTVHFVCCILTGLVQSSNLWLFIHDLHFIAITMEMPSAIPTEATYKSFDDTFPLTEDDIPLRAENRRKTDRYFLYVFLACAVLLIPVLIFALANSSSSSTTSSGSGHADRWEDDDALISYNYTTSKDNQLIWMTNHSGQVAWRLAIASSVSVGLCVLMAFLFRYATDILVWGILIICWLAMLAVCIFLWTLPSTTFVPQILYTIYTLGLLFILVFLKNRIHLVVKLFQEASQAVFDMRAVFAVSSLTTLVLIVIVTVYGISTTLLLFTLSRVDDDDLTIVSLVLNTGMSFWAAEFVYGIQYMIVSGAIVKWYFTRHKETLRDPVHTSAYITFKYHLGTVAFGSLIITLVAMLRMILRSLVKSRLRVLVDCCMRHIENFLRFFTHNSFIVTAMHGTPFIQSGKRAVKLLTLNICNTIVLSSIGDFVVVMAELLTVLLSVLASVLLFNDLGNEMGNYRICCYFFVGGLALVCCATILGTFKTAFNTIFLSVCQDFMINNGADKPFAMSVNLMEFLEGSKKLYAKKIQENALPTI
ncbi:hypothetical protein NQ315_004398 [Exocentrus adspersus]|uniref:Choline transporter-like protein 1 n=1 Tax=Exocentrus adspersus TaxID=1586481 RepID=A0AAV8W9K4_9CUCU|nr:hypothetical protein NQ315_004398 [Exocentrus adspersus]